ncbi:MAG TPA: MFS transporter [Bradyrhizobium sp.]|nr:MFS transporter [Bradyrhizobium sp.]
MMINFADKAVIGIAGPSIMKSFNLSPIEFGFLGSSFFFLFAVSGVGFGFLANRVDSHKIVLLLAVLWAAIQFPIAATASYGVLVACRIALGFGEGPAYPLALHTGYQWFENSQRNVPSTFIQQGAPSGLAAAGPLLTYIIVYFGWRAAFIFLGAVGLIWAAIWWSLGFAGQTRPPRIASPVSEVTDGFSYIKVFSDPTFLSVVLLFFVEYAMTALLFVWIPAYLTLGLQFSKIETGWIFSLINFASIPALIGIAKISGDMLRRGTSSRISRGIVTSASAVLGGIFFFMLTTGISPIAKVVCLAVGTLLAGLIFSFGPLMIAEICPQGRRGGLLGIVNSIGTLAGIVAPIAMGAFVQANAASGGAGYERGFLMLSILLAVSGLLGILGMNPEKSRVRLQGGVPAAAGPASRASI